jgi:hypothetical protein
MTPWPVVLSSSADCGIGTITLGECYMVKDEVWDQVWFGRRKPWHEGVDLSSMARQTARGPHSTRGAGSWRAPPSQPRGRLRTLGRSATSQVWAPLLFGIAPQMGPWPCVVSLPRT